MTTAYGTFIKDLKDSLLATVRNTTSFASSVSADFVKTPPYNPFCLLRLRSDTQEDIGPLLTRHLVNFELWVSYIGSYKEASLDSIISYVGEIVDEIESDRTLGSSNIKNTEITMVDYSFREAESAVRHTAKILVEIEGIRNA